MTTLEALISLPSAFSVEGQTAHARSRSVTLLRSGLFIWWLLQDPVLLQPPHVMQLLSFLLSTSWVPGSFLRALLPLLSPLKNVFLTDKKTKSGGTCSWGGIKSGSHSACSLYPREPPGTGNGWAPPVYRAPTMVPGKCL